MAFKDNNLLKKSFKMFYILTILFLSHFQLNVVLNFSFRFETHLAFFNRFFLLSFLEF